MNDGENKPAAPGRPLLDPGLPRNVPDAKLRLRQLWDGDVPLVQTFWVYFMAVVFILRLVARAAGPGAWVFDMIGIAWAAFMIKPIISAADKYPGDKIWAILAKIVAGVIALGVLTDLLSF